MWNSRFFAWYWSVRTYIEIWSIKKLEIWMFILRINTAHRSKKLTVLSQLLKKVFRKSLHKIQCCIFTVWNNTCVLISSGTSGTSQIYVAFSNLKMQLQMSLAVRNISGVNFYLLFTLPPLRRRWCQLISSYILSLYASIP